MSISKINIEEAPLSELRSRILSILKHRDLVDDLLDRNFDTPIIHLGELIEMIKNTYRFYSTSLARRVEEEMRDPYSTRKTLYRLLPVW